MTSQAESMPLWIVLILLLLILRLVIVVSTPLLILIHELAHALPALLLRKKQVCIELGVGRLIANGKLGALRFAIGSQRWDQGRTSYEGKPESIAQAIAIIGIAPAISLGISIAALTLWWSQPALSLPMHLLLAGSWLANTSIVFQSLNPWSAKTSFRESVSENQENAGNDLRDLLQHLKGSDSS
jgi:hypothetical protein